MWPDRSSRGGRWPALRHDKRPDDTSSTPHHRLTNNSPCRSSNRVRFTLAMIDPSEVATEPVAALAIACTSVRSSVSVLTMNSAAGIPLPQTSPITRNR